LKPLAGMTAKEGIISPGITVSIRVNQVKRKLE